MEEPRYRQGLAMAEKLNPEGTKPFEAMLKDVAPDFHRLIVEFAYGDILSRPQLDLKAREIATVAALTAIGHAQPQLRYHLNAALNVGWTRAEVAEVLMQMALYAGVPAALNALSLAKEVFAERDAKGLS